MTDSFRTIKGPAQGLYKDKGSKFISYIFPVHDEATVKKLLAEIKKEHHAARHWCYAYRLGADKKRSRSNDDGEPSGTAGKPILNQVLSADLTNVLIIVVRYFGGTLLGTSGLIQAYKSSAADAIHNAEVIVKEVCERISVSFQPHQTSEVMRLLKQNHAKIIEHSFQEKEKILFEIKISLTGKLRDAFKKSNIQTEIISL